MHNVLERNSVLSTLELTSLGSEWFSGEVNLKVWRVLLEIQEHITLPPLTFFSCPIVSFQFPVSKPSVSVLVIFQICISGNNVKQLLAFPSFCPTCDSTGKMKSHGNFICVLEEKQALDLG